MINNREVYQMQKDIEQLKSKTFATNWGELKEGVLTINRSDIIPPRANYNAEEPISILVFKQPHDVKKAFLTLAEMREDGFFYGKFSFNENPEKEFDFDANYHGSFVAMTTPIENIELVYTEDETLKNQCIEKNIEVGAIISSARAVDDSEVIKVNQARGIDKLVTKYAGDPGQLVVNTETKRLHIMDGETSGGTIIPNMQDLSNVEVDLTNYYNKAEVDEKVDGIDLSNYYNKTEVDEKIPPKDFGEFISYDSGIKFPKGYNNEDFAIITQYNLPGVNKFVINPERRGGLYGRYVDAINDSLDFSSKVLGNEDLVLTSQNMITDRILKSPQKGSSSTIIQKLKSFGFTNVESITATNTDELYHQGQLVANTENINKLLGKTGQLVVNKETKTIHVMDGKKSGGTALATKDDIEEVFQSVSNGKSKIETAITDKGGTVSKVNNVATFDELVAAINTIPVGDPDHVCKEEGKQELLEMMISKLPSLEGKLTIDSTLSDFAHYLNMIGEMLFAFREMFNSIPIESIEGSVNPILLEQFQAVMDMNVMEDRHTPFTEVFSTFNIPELLVNTTPITLSTTIAEKIDVTEEAFGHVVYFRDSTTYMFDMNKLNFDIEKDHIGLKKDHILIPEDSNGIKVTNINMEEFNEIINMEVEI